MSFPNTIDAAVSAAEQPAKFGTFLNLSNRYQIQSVVIDALAGTWQLVAKKSTDGGVTWSTVGVGPMVNVFGVGEVASYAAAQVGATAALKIWFSDAVDGLSITTFTMGADAWSGVNSPAPALPSSQAAGEGSFFLQQSCLAYRAADNALLVIVVGDSVTLDDVPHSLCVFSVYDIVGDTFTAWTPLGFSNYSNITTWDMVPCGLVIDAAGKATAYTQQVARAGPGDTQSLTFLASGMFSLPLDAAGSPSVRCWGPGGGGGGDLGTGSGGGGGGGGGGFAAGVVSMAPGDSIAVTVGTGGAIAGAGSGPTSVSTVSAGPGQGGQNPADGGAGGAGGTGDFVGGAGGAHGSGTGGGGGGVAGPAGNGNDGEDGDTVPTFGGGGGLAGDPLFPGNGGTGGNEGASNPPNFGSEGGPFAGAGGGGQGDNSDGVANQGVGVDGAADFTWLSVRNTNNCRLFQQTINLDGSLGVLTEIPEGAYPSRPKGVQPVPVSFDCAIRGTRAIIAFTGVTGTAGRDSIAVGIGTSASPIAFAFQTFDSGNGGNDADSCPAVALGAGVAYCCYISAPDASPISFLMRGDFGLGFGAALAVGTIASPDVRQYGRLQATVLVTLPELTFGTPTTGSLVVAPPG